ncbi:hypothetical protein BLNAU_14980 [Blattamonas nauphoetae]|uniref:USP domain-containing protein n=1 Tax=Blattamonas nauphoetae TaxID=2049346 RepID=A0ABQ9XFH4_9EUKA|nr:hypothetical protein BLNAU_14980 [Blattamonas nauphoetae]
MNCFRYSTHFLYAQALGALFPFNHSHGTSCLHGRGTRILNLTPPPSFHQLHTLPTCHQTHFPFAVKFTEIGQHQSLNETIQGVLQNNQPQPCPLVSHIYWLLKPLFSILRVSKRSLTVDSSSLVTSLWTILGYPNNFWPFTPSLRRHTARLLFLLETLLYATSTNAIDTFRNLQQFVITLSFSLIAKFPQSRGHVLLGISLLHPFASDLVRSFPDPDTFSRNPPQPALHYQPQPILDHYFSLPFPSILQPDIRLVDPSLFRLSVPPPSQYAPILLNTLSQVQAGSLEFLQIRFAVSNLPYYHSQIDDSTRTLLYQYMREPPLVVNPIDNLDLFKPPSLTTGAANEVVDPSEMSPLEWSCFFNSCWEMIDRKDFPSLQTNFEQLERFQVFLSSNQQANAEHFKTLLSLLLQIICVPDAANIVPRPDVSGFTKLGSRALSSIAPTNNELRTSMNSEVLTAIQTHPTLTALHTLFMSLPSAPPEGKFAKLKPQQSEPLNVLLTSLDEFTKINRRFGEHDPTRSSSHSEQLSIRLQAITLAVKSASFGINLRSCVPPAKRLQEQFITLLPNTQMDFVSFILAVIPNLINKSAGQDAFSLFDNLQSTLARMNPIAQTVLRPATLQVVRASQQYLQYGSSPTDSLGFLKDGDRHRRPVALNPINTSLLVSLVRIPQNDDEKEVFALINKLLTSREPFDKHVSEGILTQTVFWFTDLTKQLETVNEKDIQPPHKDEVFHFSKLVDVIRANDDIWQIRHPDLYQKISTSKQTIIQNHPSLLEVVILNTVENEQRDLLSKHINDPSIAQWSSLFSDNLAPLTLSTLTSKLNSAQNANKEWGKKFVKSEGLNWLIVHLTMMLAKQKDLGDVVGLSTTLLKLIPTQQEGGPISLSDPSSLITIKSIDTCNPAESWRLVVFWTFASVFVQNQINHSANRTQKSFSPPTTVLPFTLEKKEEKWTLKLVSDETPQPPNDATLNPSLPMLSSILSLSEDHFDSLIKKQDKFATFCSLFIIPEVFLPEQLRLEGSEPSTTTFQVAAALVALFSKHKQQTPPNDFFTILEPFITSNDKTLGSNPFQPSSALHLSLLSSLSNAPSSDPNNTLFTALLDRSATLDTLLTCLSVLLVLPRRLFDVPIKFEKEVCRRVSALVHKKHGPTGVSRLVEFLRMMLKVWESIEIPAVPITRIRLNAPTMGEEHLSLRTLTTLLHSLLVKAKEKAKEHEKLIKEQDEHQKTQQLLRLQEKELFTVKDDNELSDKLLKYYLFPQPPHTHLHLEEDEREALVDLVMIVESPTELQKFFAEKQADMNKLHIPFPTPNENGRRGIAGPFGACPKGLYNPRMACFMNAVIVQLFHNKQFSRKILSFPEQSPTDLRKDEPRPSEIPEIKTAHEQAHEQVVTESKNFARSQARSLAFAHLQRLFASLCLHDPKQLRVTDFAKVLSDCSDEVFSELRANDSEDFVKAVLNMIDVFYHENNSPHFASELFGCITVKQLRCEKGHDSPSPTLDAGFVYSVEIHNSANLVEALRNQMQGKKGSTMQCLQCNPSAPQIVPAEVRKFIACPSDSLMLFLNRKQLNETLSTQRCEFGLELDLFPFSFESHSAVGVDRSLFLYRLVGFEVYEVRDGINHFFSIVQDRHSQKWWKMNDDVVTEFDINERSQYFGGGQQQYATLLFFEREGADTPIVDETALAEAALKRPLPSSAGHVDPQMQKEWDETFPLSLSVADDRRLRQLFLSPSGLQLLKFVFDNVKWTAPEERKETTEEPASEERKKEETVEPAPSVEQPAKPVNRFEGRRVQKVKEEEKENPTPSPPLLGQPTLPLTLPLLQALFHQFLPCGQRMPVSIDALVQTIKSADLSNGFLRFLVDEMGEMEIQERKRLDGEQRRTQLRKQWEAENRTGRMAHQTNEKKKQEMHKERVQEVQNKDPQQEGKKGNAWKKRGALKDLKNEAPEHQTFVPRVLPPEDSRPNHPPPATPLLVLYLQHCKREDLRKTFTAVLIACLGQLKNDDDTLEPLLNHCVKMMNQDDFFSFLEQIRADPSTRHLLYSTCLIQRVLKEPAGDGRVVDLLESDILADDFSIERIPDQSRPLFVELVSRHLPFLLRSEIRTVQLIDRLTRFDAQLTHVQNISSFTNAILTHFVKVMDNDLTTNSLTNPSSPFLHHTLLFFHTLIAASSYSEPDLTQFGRLLSIILETTADPSVPCLVLGSVLSHFCMTHTDTLDIIKSPQYFDFLFGGRQVVKRDGRQKELNVAAQHVLMNPFLSPFRTTTGEDSADPECVLCSKRTMMPSFVEVKSDLIESTRLVRPNPQITTRDQLNRFLPITSSCPSDTTVCDLLAAGPTHSAEDAHQLVTELLSTFTSKLRNVDENQFLFVRLDTLVDTITALLIDGKEATDPHTIIRVSSHLICENKKKAFITPELIDILLKNLSNRTDSTSALSTHTSILRLLLLLLNSLDEDTLPLRSSLVSFFTSDRIQSLLPNQKLFECGTESETLPNSTLLSSFFTLLINIFLILLRRDPSFAGHIPFSSIVHSLEGCVSDGPDKASLLILIHHLLEVLLSCSSHSTFLAILDSFNNCPSALDRVWGSTTAHFAVDERDENEAAPSTHPPLVERARQAVLQIEPHTNLVTRAFNHRIQNDTESPPLLSLLFTNSSQQEVIRRRQDTFGSAFNTKPLSAEQVVMDPFFSDLLMLFGHFEKLFNDSKQRPSLLLSGNLFLRLFDLFKWLTTDSFSFDINLVAISKIQFLLTCLSPVNIDLDLVSPPLIHFATTSLNIFHQPPNIQQSIFRPPQNDEKDRRPEMLLPFLNLSAVIARHLAPISPNTSIQLLIPLVLLHHLPSLPEIRQGLPSELFNSFFQIVDDLSTAVDFTNFPDKQTITARIKGICGTLFELEPTSTFAESSLFGIPFFSSFTFVCFLVDPVVFSTILHVFNCQLNRRDGMNQSSLLTLPGTTLATSINFLLQLFMTPLIYTNTPTIAKSIVLLKSVLPPDFRITKQSTFSRDAVKPLFDRLTSKEETRPAADAFLHLITIPVTITFCPIDSTPHHVIDPPTLNFLNEHLHYVCGTLSTFLSSPGKNAKHPEIMIRKLNHNSPKFVSVKSLLLVEGSCWMDCLRTINDSFLTPLFSDLQTLLRIFSFTEPGWASPVPFQTPPKRQSPPPPSSTLQFSPPPTRQSSPSHSPPVRSPPSQHSNVNQQTPKPKYRPPNQNPNPTECNVDVNKSTIVAYVAQTRPDSKQKPNQRKDAEFSTTRSRT